MASDGILIKLVVDEPENETQILEFEQDTIKIGRGRPGKARKGVDVQLTDTSVARVAAVIQVRKEDDVSIMDMGSGGTQIDGKKVGGRGKLSSGTEMLIGNTKIVIYIGEDALQITEEETSSEAIAPIDGDELAVETFVSYDSLDASDTGPQPAFSEQTYDEPLAMGGDAVGFSSHVVANGDSRFGSAALTPPPLSSSSTGESTEASDVAPVAFDATAFAKSEGFAEGSDTPAIPEGYNFAPMHETPTMRFGPVGPTAAPLPEHFTGPNLDILLDVNERLGKEIWFRETPIW